MSHKRLIGMKINRYRSLTGWVRVLSEGPFCPVMMTTVTWMPQASGNIIRSGQRWASYELSEVNMRHIFPHSSSCYLNSSELRQGTTGSIWSQIELLIKSQMMKPRRARCSQTLIGIHLITCTAFHLFLSSDFHEVYSVININKL